MATQLSTPQETSAEPAPGQGQGAPPPAPRSLLRTLLDLKEWIGLGLAVVAALVSSAGWVMTYFAKKEEVEILSCTMDANVRIAKNAASVRFIGDRHLQMRREIKAYKPGQPLASGDAGADYETLDELKAAAKVAKENIKTLSDDTAYLVTALSRKECDSREGRQRLADRMRNDPPLKEY